jgi:hypothetical protein
VLLRGKIACPIARADSPSLSDPAQRDGPVRISSPDCHVPAALEDAFAEVAMVGDKESPAAHKTRALRSWNAQLSDYRSKTNRIARSISDIRSIGT